MENFVFCAVNICVNVDIDITKKASPFQCFDSDG